MFIALAVAVVGTGLFFIIRKKNKAVAFQIKIDNIIITDMFTLSILQSSILNITPIDRIGNLSQIQPGSLSVISSNPAIFTVVPFGATFKILGQGVGTAKLIVTGDADLGTPVKTITNEVDIIVTSELAVGFNITFSPPVDK